MPKARTVAEIEESRNRGVGGGDIADSEAGSRSKVRHRKGGKTRIWNIYRHTSTRTGLHRINNKPETLPTSGPHQTRSRYERPLDRNKETRSRSRVGKTNEGPGGKLPKAKTDTEGEENRNRSANKRVQQLTNR